MFFRDVLETNERKLHARVSHNLELVTNMDNESTDVNFVSKLIIIEATRSNMTIRIYTTFVYNITPGLQEDERDSSHCREELLEN